MPHITQRDLYNAGVGEYACYRIPALLTTRTGAILAFCEGRKYSCNDSDHIDILLTRSTDDGATFSEPTVVATTPEWVCGNPAPVQDRTSGRIWLLFTKNRTDGDETMVCEGTAPRQVWKCCSDDDGVTWSRPVEITSSVKPADGAVLCFYERGTTSPYEKLTLARIPREYIAHTQEPL